MKKEKKLIKSQNILIIGLIPFIIYTFLAGGSAVLYSAGTDKPYILEYIRAFFEYCKFFWPSTILGVIFIFVSFFYKNKNR